MRYSASEKLEIIRTAEQSYLPVRRTLERIGLPCATFYRCYDLYTRLAAFGLWPIGEELDVFRHG
jgi:putative transposase